jgi:hypothetical protein
MMLMGRKDLKTTIRYIRAVQLQRQMYLNKVSTNWPHKKYGRHYWQP